MKYVGLSRYTDESVEKLLEVEQEGVVLGTCSAIEKCFPIAAMNWLRSCRLLRKKVYLSFIRL